MLLKKVLFKDISDDNGFTEDSYLIVDIPSLKEKLSLKRNITKESEDDIEKNVEAIASLVKEINCTAIDDDKTIADWDTLTCYAFSTQLVNWLGHIMLEGFVPKKKLIG